MNGKAFYLAVPDQESENAKAGQMGDTGSKQICPPIYGLGHSRGRGGTAYRGGDLNPSISRTVLNVLP